jgi:signal transduction histidine kinase
LPHPPLLEDVGLAPRCVATWRVLRRSGIGIDLRSPAIGRVPLPVKTVLFRIMQECLNNIHRHSGSSTACVRVSRTGRTLTLQVEDVGRGFPSGAVSASGEPVAHMGVGIPAIQERLRHVGGTLQIRPRRKKTVVTVNVPLERSSGISG